MKSSDPAFDRFPDRVFAQLSEQMDEEEKNDLPVLKQRLSVVDSVASSQRFDGVMTIFQRYLGKERVVIELLYRIRIWKNTLKSPAKRSIEELFRLFLGDR